MYCPLCFHWNFYNPHLNALFLLFLLFGIISSSIKVLNTFLAVSLEDDGGLTFFISNIFCPLKSPYGKRNSSYGLGS